MLELVYIVPEKMKAKVWKIAVLTFVENSIHYKDNICMILQDLRVNNE